MTPPGVNQRVPPRIHERIIAVRDEMTEARQANIGSGQATIAEALSALLDWWEGTRELRETGLTARALLNLISEGTRRLEEDVKRS